LNGYKDQAAQCNARAMYLACVCFQCDMTAPLHKIYNWDTILLCKVIQTFWTYWIIC